MLLAMEVQNSRCLVQGRIYPVAHGPHVVVVVLDLLKQLKLQVQPA